MTVERYRFDGRDVVDLPPTRAPASAGDVVADGVPESGDLAQPGCAGRPSARRGVRGSRRDEPDGGDPAGRRQAPAGRDRRPATAGARLSARAFRRHEAARRHRHGADGQAEAVHRRRADDRSRRHRATADLRPPSSGQPGGGRIGPADLPRHRRGRRALQPNRRDVRRAGRRRGRHRRSWWAARPPIPYTRALVAAVPDMAVDRDQPLASIPGRPPDPAQPGARLSVRATLPTTPTITVAPSSPPSSHSRTAGASPAGIRNRTTASQHDQQVVRS